MENRKFLGKEGKGGVRCSSQGAGKGRVEKGSKGSGRGKCWPRNFYSTGIFAPKKEWDT